MLNFLIFLYLRAFDISGSTELIIVSLIYFIVSEIIILTKFRWEICYTFKINCTGFEKMHGFPINMQWKIIFRIKCKLPVS